MVNNMFIYIYARLSQTRRGGSQCWDLRFLYFFCLVTSFWGGNVFSFLFYILFEMFPSSLGFSNIWFSLLFIHGVFVCLLFLLFYNNFRHILFLFKRIEWQILLHKYKGQVISTYRDNTVTYAYVNWDTHNTSSIYCFYDLLSLSSMYGQPKETILHEYIFGRPFIPTTLLLSSFHGQSHLLYL